LAKEYKAEEICRKSPAGGIGGAKGGDPPLRAGPDIRNEVLSITEGATGVPSDILQTFLDIFWLTAEEYRFRCKIVRGVLKNDTKTFHVIERAEGSSSRFRLRKLGTCIPDARTGAVPLMPFPIYHPKKIGLLIVGDQYDLWFGESVSKDAQASAKQLVLGLMNSTVPLGEGITKRESGLFDGVYFDAPLRLQFQGYEDAGFRNHFDAEVAFARSESKTNPYVYIREKSTGSELFCTEANCVDVFSWISWVSGPSPPSRDGAAGPAAARAQSGGGGAERPERAPRVPPSTPY
jgi:hypothetical protein